MSLTATDKREYQEYLDLRNRIQKQTLCLIPKETEVQKANRIQKLKGNFFDFAKYYFPYYCDAEFAWFHKKAVKEIVADPNCFAILEFPREHAKSVLVDILLAMFLYINEQITGMVIASANQDKAETLLSDIQTVFEANELFINDHGNLITVGDWTNGSFSTTDGVGFWAFGRGQSPRGIRKAEKRPNYIVVDDIDDKGICKNEERVREAVDWILEDLYGAASIKGARLIVAGNRIHSKSILAHLVGDIEPADPKREGIIHIKVYARENPKTHTMDENGTPAWKERYTVADLKAKMMKMGWRSSQREYYHQHIAEGVVFKNEWIEWVKVQHNDKYDLIEFYGDPSFKNTKASDYKAIVGVGLLPNGKMDILFAWVRQATIRAMVAVFYDVFNLFGNAARYRIEANMLQDLFLDEFVKEGDERGFQMPIRADKQKKEDKYTRIENLTPLYERGMIRYNEAMRQNPDMQVLIHQTLAFPTGHDDGPDALQGAVSFLQAQGRSANLERRSGRFQFPNSKYQY